MPIGAQDHLEALYAKQRLLTEEVARLESERDRSHAGDASDAEATDPSDAADPADADLTQVADAADADADRRYLLDIEIDALRLESLRIAARISDVLDRDLQR